jgi:phosphoribosylaminoimidazole-succinocarboxamide synthase
MTQEPLPGLNLVNRGKVRDIYAFDNHLLLVATDRISAFDVILPSEIPEKGKILTAMSAYWLGIMKDIIPHHLITTDFDRFPSLCQPYREQLEGRTMLVKKSTPAPIECIVRGYLAGSGWKEYQRTGAVCGINLPQGLLESSRLEEPIFTPSTKASVGQHDINITYGEMIQQVGRENAAVMRDASLAIYSRARTMAEAKGIIIADTKLEFGLESDGVILIDELLTPDSSRFWPAESYIPGKTPDSFDKQYVRDYLINLPWNMAAPPPLPQDVIQKTRNKYAEALIRLIGS